MVLNFGKSETGSRALDRSSYPADQANSDRSTTNDDPQRNIPISVYRSPTLIGFSVRRKEMKVGPAWGHNVADSIAFGKTGDTWTPVWAISCRRWTLILSGLWRVACAWPTDIPPCTSWPNSTPFPLRRMCRVRLPLTGRGDNVGWVRNTTHRREANISTAESIPGLIKWGVTLLPLCQRFPWRCFAPRHDAPIVERNLFRSHGKLDDEFKASGMNFVPRGSVLT